MARSQTNIRLPNELKMQIMRTEKVPKYCNLSERIIRLLELSLSESESEKKINALIEAIGTRLGTPGLANNPTRQKTG